jgi:3-hydroxyisobutyrate dehydrogenase-like beta-hydroxyacid dehydrogenase
VLDLPEDAWFDVQLAHKDIRLALATGRTEGTPLPSAAVADKLFTKASELGYGHRDVASLFEVLGRVGVT